MNKTKLHLTLLSFLIISLWGCSQSDQDGSDQALSLIPRPLETTIQKGQLELTSVQLKGADFKKELDLLSNFFQEKNMPVKEGGTLVEIIRNDTLINEEAYILEIGESVRITARGSEGAFYAIQTLKQLWPEGSEEVSLPKLRIYDKPAFKIRGFMHDTGRNYQSLEQLKEQIDLLAFYKYNVFHWHLTDNPGWRLESKRYPELQSDSAFSRHHGKYYSQEDFREIIDYCAERNITVIPELDIPGHTAAFRRAFGFKTMREEGVEGILQDLFQELCELASPEEMPYIHIGTDEVKMSVEAVDHKVIKGIMDLLKKNKREVIVWKEGIVVREDSLSINQLWAMHEGREGHRFIDSRSNYINHLDPFAGMARLYFQQPCRQAEGDELALGGILCAWPDNNVADERDILRQNPVYPSMVFYSDAIWRGRKKDYKEFWSKLPEPGSQELNEFKDFEELVINHRDRYFTGKPFPYVRQSDMTWKLIGPFDHQGDVEATFPPEEQLSASYEFENVSEQWEGPYVGGTIHLRHFFGFESFTDKTEGTYYAYTRIKAQEQGTYSFWVGFHGWSRAGGRRGGPTPQQGDWHTSKPWVKVNGSLIEPPIWQQPGLGVKTPEIPFVDEDYFYRPATRIALNKGWNEVLVKIPKHSKGWKWMFTFVPVASKNGDIREAAQVQFDQTIKIP